VYKSVARLEGHSIKIPMQIIITHQFFKILVKILAFLNRMLPFQATLDLDLEYIFQKFSLGLGFSSCI